MVHVLAVGAGVGEPLQTLLALERLFAAMQPLVFGQVVLVLEGVQTLKHLAINLLELTMTIMKKTENGYVVEKVFPDSHLLQIETNMFN